MKKKIFKKIFIIFSLFLICILPLNIVYASDIELENIEIKAVLDENGNAHIQEIWKIDVYEGTEIYKVFDNMRDSKISHFKVVDDTGKNYQNIGEWDIDANKEDKDGKCGIVTREDGYYELCFGIGRYGRREYKFEYDISNFVQQYQDTQGFNYAFFSEMELEPQHVKITLSSPYSFHKSNAKIWGFGFYGSVLFENGNVVMETTESVPEGAKMQLLMQIKNHTFKNAHKNNSYFEDILDDAIDDSDYEDDLYNQGNYYNAFPYKDNTLFIVMCIFIPMLLILVVIIIFVTAYTKGKKEYQFNDHVLLDKDEVNMFRDIPCHKDIFEFYYLSKKIGLINDNDRSGLIAAILLRWIQKGYIEFKKEEVKQFLFFKKDGYSVNLDKEIPVKNQLEENLLYFFKKAAGANKILETDEFEDWCRRNYDEIDEWFDDVDKFVEEELRNQGLLTLEVTYTHFMGIKFSHNTDTYHASIREEMEHILGLKKFLEEMSLIDEKEVIEVKLWEEYLIFASILGIADKVQKQLGQLCPTFNEESSLDTIYTMHMVHMFSYNSMYASQQASRSSGMGGGSSFSGGGGGFSGGGGGGVR